VCSGGRRRRHDSQRHFDDGRWRCSSALGDRREGGRRRLCERPLRQLKGKKAARCLALTYAGREEEVSGNLRPVARDQWQAHLGDGGVDDRLWWHSAETCTRENRVVSSGGAERPQRWCGELTDEDHRDGVALRRRPWRRGGGVGPARSE
jgi:hypothetical protein